MTSRILGSEDLRVAQRHICDAFDRDCYQRAAHASFQPGVFASGHYFDEPAHNQRGLHGTAAALRVLGAACADPASAARATATGLVQYLQEREAFELARASEVNAERERSGGGRDEEAHWRDKLRHDSVSTSKQADVLYALQFVPPEVAATDALQVATTRLLDSGRAKDGFGWAWTLDGADKSDDLATAYVIRSLARRGRDVRAEAKWLRTRLHSRLSGAPSRQQLEGDCLVLHVLVETKGVDESEARSILDLLWKNLADDLDRPRTLRRSFDESGRDHYVIVHWQLHLVALVALIRPFRYYLSPRVQQFLAATTEAVSEKRSLNPDHDGDRASTRHYGYTYDTIQQCIAHRPRTGLPDTSLAWLIDSIAMVRRVGLGVLWTLLGAIAPLLLIAILYSWLSSNDAWYGDLGPELAGAAIVGLLVATWRYYRSRRP